ARRDSTPPAATAASGMAAARSAPADSTAGDARREVASVAQRPRFADSMRIESKAAPVPQSPATSQRRAFANAPVQLSEVVATGMTQTVDPHAFGCYRLDIDSLRARLTALRQFGLSAPDSSGLPVVRALTSSGHADSVIPGARWRSVGHDSVMVSTSRG